MKKPKPLHPIKQKPLPRASNPAPQRGLGYISAKAKIYTKIGPVKYRKQDALKRPRLDLGARTLDLVMKGMEQLVAGHGFSETDPLNGLGVDGCYALMDTLHFECQLQAVVASDFSAGWILDKLVMRHCVTGLQVTVFNRVSSLKDK